MKKSHKKQSKKLPKVLFLCLLTAALLVIVGLIWAKHQHTSQPKVTSGAFIDNTPATPADNLDNEKRKSSSPSSTPTTKPEGSLDITITRASADSQAKKVYVGTIVSGTDSGTCILTFKHSGYADVVVENSVERQNNAYVCPNFTVSFDQFPVSGDWTVSVNLSNATSSKTAVWPNPITINQ
ncbi:MAG: hypothetical protein JWO41_181 [Candidatus Saccharibacteria bacterium]|nr:hypothetical protein [Candidatus Saccharibacteria bacterium]